MRQVSGLDDVAEPGRQVGRCRRMAIVAAAAIGMVLGLSAPARATTMSLSTNKGPPGTQVTVRLTDLRIPCEVRFDELLVVGEQGCQPSGAGDASPSFAVPAEATPGNHQVRVTARRPGSSTQLSSSFQVTAAPAPTRRPASPARRSTAARTPQPGTGATATPSLADSPAAPPGPAGPTPTAAVTGPPSPGTSQTQETDAVRDAAAESGPPAGMVALIAVGAGLAVAAGTYRLVSRRHRRGT